MKLNCRLLATICWLVASNLHLHSQDTTGLNSKVGLQYTGKVSAKADELNRKLDKKSQKTLQQKTGIANEFNREDTMRTLEGPRILYLNPRIYKSNDTVWRYSGICKVLQTTMYISKPGIAATIIKAPEKKTPVLKITGNVQYDFLYRSFIDTPFSQHNFQQHTVQTSLNIVVKDKYPLRLNLSTRLSNSPYFRNFFDAGFLFDRHAYTRNLKQQLLNKIAAVQLERPDIKTLETAIKEEIDRYNSLKTRLSDPDILQRIIEERERQYYKNIALTNGAGTQQDPPGMDIKTWQEKLIHKKAYSVMSDSSKLIDNSSNYSNFIDSKKKELDSLQQNIQRLQVKVDSLKNDASKNVATIRQKIYKATSRRELEKIAMENGIAAEKRKGVESFLSNVKSIGIGRSAINYSELTAWNVSLTGLNMEYNPGIYAAVAAGKIDYGFRDFLGRNSRRKDQTLLMARIGLGDKEKRAIIFSAFTGRKYNYGSVVADTVSSHLHVAGYSLETILKKDENTSLSAEIAKTTRPVSGRWRDNNTSKDLLNFSDNTNLGISIKGQTVLKETNTRVSGFYRKTGQNFQSFSLFTYNTDQTAWLLKLDQSFLKDKIELIAMLRRNDFTNPFTEKTFRTSTVFKSLQLNARFPKWPTLSAGYYPGSQLYVIDNERIRENAYYIMNGSIIHNYVAGSIRMISSLMYNRYSSKGTDSGFIAYNGVSYMISQSFILGKAQLQGLFTYTDQEQMQFSTLEANADYAPSSFIRIGGGVKYNKIMSGDSYWGSRAQLGIELKKLGGLQLQYEKSYLPTIYQTLFPVEIGRVTWFKYF